MPCHYVMLICVFRVLPSSQCLNSTTFSPAQKKSVPFSSHFIFSLMLPSPLILEPTVCKLVCSSIHVNGIMHHSHFWFLLLSVMLSRHIHVITSNRNSFLIWLNNIFSHKPHFAILSVCGRLECLFSTVR